MEKRFNLQIGNRVFPININLPTKAGIYEYILYCIGQIANFKSKMFLLVFIFVLPFFSNTNNKLLGLFTGNEWIGTILLFLVTIFLIRFLIFKKGIKTYFEMDMILMMSISIITMVNLVPFLLQSFFDIQNLSGTVFQNRSQINLSFLLGLATTFFIATNFRRENIRFFISTLFVGIIFSIGYVTTKPLLTILNFLLLLLPFIIIFLLERFRFPRPQFLRFVLYVIILILLAIFIPFGDSRINSPNLLYPILALTPFFIFSNCSKKNRWVAVSILSIIAFKGFWLNGLLIHYVSIILMTISVFIFLNFKKLALKLPTLNILSRKFFAEGNSKKSLFIISIILFTIGITLGFVQINESHLFSKIVIDITSWLTNNQSVLTWLIGGNSFIVLTTIGALFVTYGILGTIAFFLMFFVAILKLSKENSIDFFGTASVLSLLFTVFSMILTGINDIGFFLMWVQLGLTSISLSKKEDIKELEVRKYLGEKKIIAIAIEISRWILILSTIGGSLYLFIQMVVQKA